MKILREWQRWRSCEKVVTGPSLEFLCKSCSYRDPGIMKNGDKSPDSHGVLECGSGGACCVLEYSACCVLGYSACSCAGWFHISLGLFGRICEHTSTRVGQTEEEAQKGVLGVGDFGSSFDWCPDR